MAMGEIWTQLSSAMAGLMFIWAIFQQYSPYQLGRYLEKYSSKIFSFVYPYIHITFNEFTGERFKHSEAYAAIKTYLGDNSTMNAKHLKGEMIKDCQSLVLSMGDQEEVTDEFNGVKVWWSSSKYFSKAQSISLYPASDEKRFYKLTFHKKHRELITGTYLKHVMNEAKAAALKNRQRKLYTNNSSNNWYGYKNSVWSHVVFEHPATFETLAISRKLKQDIVNDLTRFSQGKKYYTKIGKPWKRGYLLYGPPGTGKSTMIVAMANHLNYDVYDLELTTVKDNTELRKLLIETTSKSVIVVEDIDCSLDLTGQRKKKNDQDEDDEDKEKDVVKKMSKGEEETKASKVTLSGLLNVVDGLWSACGSERIMVFTTNFVDKLDPALIRRGRMDKHIELSYCCFEAFKMLAYNYLDLDSHELFPTIRCLLEETEMTPADVAENLILKSYSEDAKTNCLENLIEALKMAKEEATKKREEEENLKVAKEEKFKARQEKKLKDEKEDNDKETSVAEEAKENGKSAKEVKENGHI